MLPGALPVLVLVPAKVQYFPDACFLQCWKRPSPWLLGAVNAAVYLIQIVEVPDLLLNSRLIARNCLLGRCKHRASQQDRTHED